MGGGVRMLLGLITPGLAWSVLQTPLTRLIAICFAWVIEEVEVACVNIGLYCCYEIFMHRIVISVYPHHAPSLISSRQCLRITASTCLLFVIICYYYDTRGWVMMPPVSDYLLLPRSFALSRCMRCCRSIHLSVSVSSITMNAVLCLQVLGGRMLHTPCLPRLQVIVIAPPIAG